MYINYDIGVDSYRCGPEIRLYYVTSKLKFYHCIHRIIGLRERENLYLALFL